MPGKKRGANATLEVEEDKLAEVVAEACEKAVKETFVDESDENKLQAMIKGAVKDAIHVAFEQVTAMGKGEIKVRRGTIRDRNIWI